jgi:hypothetical protein
MNTEILNLSRANVRGTDSNSLLRLYDQANRICAKSPPSPERTRAGRARERIVQELQRRKVSF